MVQAVVTDVLVSGAGGAVAGRGGFSAIIPVVIKNLNLPKILENFGVKTDQEVIDKVNPIF